MLHVVLNLLSNDKSISVAWSKRICLCFVLHFHISLFLTILIQVSSYTLFLILTLYSFLSPSSWVLLVSSSSGAAPLELPEAADDLAVFEAVDDKKL